MTEGRGNTTIEVVGGDVIPADLEYAWDRAHALCGHASRAVQHFRMHLYTDVEADGGSTGVADAILVFDGDVVICAGGVATTMSEAIDQLSSRLRRRMTALGRRHEERSSRSPAMAATTAT